MRLHRFYIEGEIFEDKPNTLLDKGLIHQIRRVFRLQSGDKVLFFNGHKKDYLCQIVSINETVLIFKTDETLKIKTFSKRRLVLALSLIKKDNFEWVIQKGTELGVSEFIPIMSERSEKKALNMERAKKIMIEATEQCGRGELAVIREPISLSDFLKEEKIGMIVFHTEGISFSTEDFSKTGDLVACIGPEGGWSDGEINLFKEKGAAVVKLDAPILRAETAAVSAASLLLLL